ncbi:PC-esterase domain-containing protein 1A [Aplysia californica]|uniref:PC-esterase domain-containing protein 1A n=1 Tax=Aplysia californica TaxID=6500 RepID=A0ABM0ZZA7_APLCA|nr:PC-esterase domain-containing protein 1A [Aplysia californica]
MDDFQNEEDNFSMKHVRKILKNRFVVIIGDSIQRGIYKDMVLLLQQDRSLLRQELRMKGEYCFLGDELIEGGQKGVMTNGIGYKEVRQYCTGVYLVRFYFVTRCYNNYVESILNDLKEGPQPDVLIMNSCLWDITRINHSSECDHLCLVIVSLDEMAIVQYKENLQKLFSRFSQSLPQNCLVIWNTTLPISSCARGGFLVPEIEFLTTTLRLDILEANLYAKKVAVGYGLDILDLHFHLRHQLHRRVQDGVHWDTVAHRQITHLIVGHICRAWNLPTPRYRPSPSVGYGCQAQRRVSVQHQQPLLMQPPRSVQMGPDMSMNINFFNNRSGAANFVPNRMPVEHSRMPVEQNRMRVEHDRMPVEQKRMPLEHNRMPSEQNRMRVEHDRMPVEQKRMPLEHNRMPSEQNRMRGEHNRMPVEQKRMPLEHNRMPAEQKRMPLEHNRMPAEQKRVPLEHNRMPAEQNRMYRRGPNPSRAETSWMANAGYGQQWQPYQQSEWSGRAPLSNRARSHPYKSRRF